MTDNKKKTFVCPVIEQNLKFQVAPDCFSEEDVIEILDRFLYTSESFCGICFAGMYTMHNAIFLSAFREYLISGNNYLDEYTTLKNMGQEGVCLESLPREEVERIFLQKERVLNNEGFWDVYDHYSKEEIIKFKELLLIERLQYHRYLEIERKKKERRLKKKTKTKTKTKIN